MRFSGLGRLALRSLVLLSSFALSASAQDAGRARDEKWVTIWGAMPQLTEPYNLPPPPFNGSNVVFENTTIRQTIVLTAPATTIRLEISNAFGVTPLPLTSVTVALPSKQALGVPSIRPSTLRNLTFSGAPSFSVPNGALVVSDPVSFDEQLPAHTVLSVSIYLAAGQQTNLVTSHPGSRTTSFLAPGDRVRARDLNCSSAAAELNHWYLLSAVTALLPRDYSTLAVLGDSLTDGRGSTTNGNDRWPDLLSRRLRAADVPLALINEAAGGNRLLQDGLGPNALARLDRDILAHAGPVSHTIVFHGVNDIGTADPLPAAQRAVAARIREALLQIAARLRDRGVAVFAATLTPFSGPGQVYGHPEREKTRQAVNAWIRASADVFDGVLDFDRVVRDPGNKTILLEKYDDGDHLHMNPRGYEAIAESIDLSIFT